jgi:hypothetical protein
MSIVTDRGVTCSEYVHCDGIRKRQIQIGGLKIEF